MKKNTKILKLIKKPIVIAVVFAVLFSACFALVVSIASKNKTSESPMMANINFVGEYKVGDGNWKSIEKDKHIDSTNGTVYLRGYFEMSSPDGEFLTNNPENTTITFYLNHINMSISVGGEECIFDSESDEVGVSSCGQHWISYIFPENTDGKVDITIKNPHIYGNNCAIDDLLGNIHVGNTEQVKYELENKYDYMRYFGFSVIIISIVLFIISLLFYFSKMLKNKTLLIFSFWMFFTGIVLSLHNPDSFLINEFAMYNTNMLIMGWMMSLLFFGIFVTNCLKGINKLIMIILQLINSVFTILSFILSICNTIRLYDSLLAWAIVQSVIMIFMIYCCINHSFKSIKSEKFIMWCCVVTCVIVLFDFLNIQLCLMPIMMLSKIIFSIMFIVALCFCITTIFKNYRISIHASELETEIKDKSIAIMISQIQPHFLYNSLGAIAELCVSDPNKAQKATINFSRYLRGNMNALDEKRAIEFEDELNHLNNYIELEKVRFGNALTFEYDIKSTNFTLPALTIQPLVENAVNHGIRYRRKSGSIKISSFEDDNNYYITIQDDGVGFDPDKIYNDGKKHVGLANVKYRLEVISNGGLKIESVKGKGTTITINIPKGDV